MLHKKMKIAASAFVTAYTLASPAQALFGVTCIPTLYNCACTYQVPCPVSDPQDIAKFVLEKTQMDEALTLLQDIQDPTAMMLEAMNGETAYGIPGLGSISIDLNGILNGNLSSLGISSLTGDLVSQLDNFGIDGDLLSSIASGELGVDDFLSVVDEAGLDLSTLDQIGLGLDEIESLASGDLDINGVFDLAKSVGIEAGVLNDIGITEDLIIGISQGTIDGDELFSIAEDAGLDISALESVGLDADTVAALSTSGTDFVASVLQQSGFDTSITTALGLDAGMIAQISTGELPASAIEDLVEGTGIDPDAIVLPGVDGPIRVTNEVSDIISGMGGADITADDNSSTSSSSRTFNIYDTITIPISSVPGLKNALDTAKGTVSSSTSESSFTVDDPEIAALCETNRSLISTDMAPNGFGDDVENIHMAISGGTVEIAVEANDEAMSVGASTSALGYARSIQMRPILIKAVEAIDSFDQMIEESENFQDDVIVNDTIRTHLMTAEAETTSLLAYVMSTFGSSTMKAQYLSALPIFPETARYLDLVEESSITQAELISEQIEAETVSISSNTEEYYNVASQAQDALTDYNLQYNANLIESSISSLEETIELHEDYKTNLYTLEEIIRSALKTLYGSDDDDEAWDILYPQLISAAVSTPYTDSDKWDDGYDIADELSVAVTKRTGTTAYGTRASSSNTYTRISNTAFSYSYIDSLASAQSDPYNIIIPPLYTGGSDDRVEIYGDELVGVFQYYIETARREIFYGEIRRGDIDHIMTGAFWNEMLYHAPECLSGPIEVSVDNLLDRPELFDLDKDCDHLYWSYGDEGDYIDASQLGGADAALWMSKINLDKIENITGGEEAVIEELYDAIDAINESTAATLLEMSGNSTPGENLDLMMESLEAALEDTTFSQSVSVPQL